MEILFVLVLGLLVLGPERLHTMLGYLARAKARFEGASREFKSRLRAELDAVHQERRTRTHTGWILYSPGCRRFQAHENRSDDGSTERH